MSKTAILLLAHGTADTLDDIPEYLLNVTGGRPLPPEAIAEIRHRYSLIPPSPLTKISQEQGRLLEKRIGVPVYVGMRNWKPYIRDVMAQMRSDGVTSVVAICLAPQNSRTSVGLYRKAVQAASEGMTVHFVEGWAEHPQLADAFADRLRDVWERLSQEIGHPLPVLFTAHSVPCRTIQTPTPAPGQPALPPDPYPQEAKHTAAMVADRVPGLKQWFFAFQSQGLSGGPWIGPTVEDSLDAIAAEGHKTVILQPVGFLCDHVEILYDVDILFKEHAAKQGIRLERPESLNTSPFLTEALADVAQKGLAALAEQGQPT